LTAEPHASGITSPDEAMRSSTTFSSESPSQARARLSEGFTQHVTIALAACLLALVFG
jgi:hypothetical protein